ncbi:MAG: T9SS type A sorting domain-containing protein [Bacteroidales bacterium]|nr:T9SS type A sorting domain-containing protein [Bacteroidales bacterium]
MLANPKIFLLKTKSDGSFEDTATYGVDTGYYVLKNFISLPNNKLIILSQYQRSFLSIFKQYLLYIDTGLTKVKDSLYPTINLEFYGNAKNNGNYYFTGGTSYDDNGDSIPKGNFLFLKTDSEFNIISRKSIGTINSDYPWGLINGYNNNLLFFGFTAYNESKDAWYLINADTSGQVIGQYLYGNLSNYNDEGIKSISLGYDSSYFLTGIMYQYESQGNYYSSSAVIKTDRQFNVLFTKNIGVPTTGLTVSKIISISDGNQAVLNQRTPLTYEANIYSQVTKFNNDGDILWWRNYMQGDTTQYIRYRAWDMIETSDKGLAFCGSAIDTINVGPDMEAWLVKTDSLGCDGLQSCNDTALVINVTQVPDTICKNDTAWIPVTFKGRSAPYSIYANNTLVLDSIYYPNTLPLWIDTLMPYVPLNTGMQQIIVKIKDPWGWQQSDTVQTYVKNCHQGFASETFYKYKIEIYPNPATTEVHVRIRGVLNGEYTVTLYDMQGKPVQKIITSAPEATLDISQLPQGIYTIRVLGNNMVRSERVVKK